MSGAWEQELKFRLRGESDWARLQEVLGPPAQRLEQVNTYLDTPDRAVAGGRGMVRLRSENGERVLTFKRGVRVEGGYFEAREVEVPLGEAEWERARAGDLEALEALEPLRALRDSGVRGPLAPSGEVRNLRQRFPLPSGEVLELDRTLFPNGREDFEIEVETRRPEEIRREVQALAERAGIELEVQRRTKYERFLEALTSP